MAGLLGDIFSASNTLKRKVRGLLDDPSGTLSQFVGQLGDDMNTNINNMQTGFGFGGGQSVLISPEQKAAAQRALADYGSQMGMAGATVWHGSPHKFDKFDSSKIGTGEGAQAYGHGLYLAESPGVAGQYQKTLSADGFLVGDKVFDPAKEITHKNVKYWAQKGDLEGALMTAEKIAASDSPVADIAKRDLVRLREIEAAGGISRNPGALYKVDLPDEHIAKMLDWDKPLSQQPQGAQAALAKLDPDMYHPNGGDYDPTELGQMIYQRLAQKGQDAAATSMRGAGIPGIRYLDGGSRGAGQGSSNFVVFPGNEGLLSILERNGAPIK